MHVQCTFFDIMLVGVSCSREFDVYVLSGLLGLLILKVETIRKAIFILTHRNCTERAVLDTCSASAECVSLQQVKRLRAATDIEIIIKHDLNSIAGKLVIIHVIACRTK